MKSPRYYVQEAEISIDPNFKDIDIGGASLEFEVDDSPQYDEDLGALVFETEINLDLFCYDDDLGETRAESGEDIGEVETEVKIVIEGNEAEFQKYLATWEDEGYREVDWDFRHHLESGYLTEVISPIGHLVDDSFRGVLPGLVFTEPPAIESKMSDEDEDEINDIVEKEIKRRVLDYLEEGVSADVPEEDASINVDVLSAVINIHLGEHEKELDRENVDEISDIASETMTEEVTEYLDGTYSAESPTVRITDESDSAE
jgi:hypothetical protein